VRTIFTIAVPVFLATCAVAAPPEVAVVRPIEKEITDTVDLTGRAGAKESVDIRSRVTGYLEKVLFKEGSLVKKGDVLFQLDERVQRAELSQIEAEVVVADAKLKVAEANFQRMMNLLKAAAISREEFDMAQATMDVAKAESNAVRAKLMVAKLNLDFTRIASPINGRIGRCNVSAGNLVKGDGGASLATIVVTDPLYVYFDIDERTMLRMIRLNRDHKEKKVAVGVAFADEEGFPHQTTLDFVNNRVNPETGAVTARAVLENSKGELLPGMFAKVRIAIGEPHKALLVPTSAIFRDGERSPEAYYVFVVSDKNVVVKRQVKVGMRVGIDLAIEDGLKATESILEDYNCGATPGTEIVPRQRKPKLSPKPKGDDGVSAPRPAPELPSVGPALIVSAKYPGADATAVEDTVARPITMQIRGLDGLIQQVATCSNDGEMRLMLLMKKGTDLNQALILAQNRVALAEPQLPDEVRQGGITIRKRSVPLLNVAIQSPNGKYNRQFLASYAKENLRDELCRVAGVGETAFFGEANPGPQMRVELDRVRLAARSLTVNDVIAALQSQNISTAKHSAEKIDVSPNGRGLEAEELAEVILKVSKDGGMVRLRDVARVETTSGFETTTSVDGKPCVMLTVSRIVDADEKATAKAVREKLDELKKALPEGLELKVVGE
jgi:RND family efflux transporter MFP subunit